MKLAIAFRSSAKKPKIVASSVLCFYMQEMSLIWISLPCCSSSSDYLVCGVIQY